MNATMATVGSFQCFKSMGKQMLLRGCKILFFRDFISDGNPPKMMTGGEINSKNTPHGFDPELHSDLVMYRVKLIGTDTQQMLTFIDTVTATNQKALILVSYRDSNFEVEIVFPPNNSLESEELNDLILQAGIKCFILNGPV